MVQNLLNGTPQANCKAAGAFARSAHGNPARFPFGCGTCHVGHGPPKTAMLPSLIHSPTAMQAPAWTAATNAAGVSYRLAHV